MNGILALLMVVLVIGITGLFVINHKVKTLGPSPAKDRWRWIWKFYLRVFIPLDVLILISNTLYLIHH